MSDDIKPAVLSEGDTTRVFERFNPGAVPADRDEPSDGNVETPSRTATQSPSVEAEPGDDPQAPNREGEG